MLTEQQYTDLVAKMGKEVGNKIKGEFQTYETTLNTKQADVLKGLMPKEDFEKFKDDSTAKLNETLKSLEKLEEASKAQGEKMNALLERPGGAKLKNIDEFMAAQIPKLIELKKAGSGYIEVTGEQLKAAGVTSISNAITNMTSPPGSPYAPGLDGTALELFDIVRNQNFMINRVSLGNTNQSRLAWINETNYQGTPGTNVAEGATKPLTQHNFQVEYSAAKKAAAYIILTEEFDADLPGLTADVKNMLQADVIRAFDDQIQTDVINVAKPFNITGLNTQIYDANLWDAIFAELVQIGFNNFEPNTAAWNWIEEGRIQMQKDTQGRYLQPPFLDEINRLKVRANKMPTGFGLAGDLRQYQVRMYKDYTMRMGWINDQLITNQFSVVGELRYHSFISDNRKNAIVYHNLDYIRGIINGTPHS